MASRSVNRSQLTWSGQSSATDIMLDGLTKFMARQFQLVSAEF